MLACRDFGSRRDSRPLIELRRNFKNECDLGRILGTLLVLESLGGQARNGWLAPWIASAVAIVAALAMAAPASGQATLAAAGAQPAEVAPEPAAAAVPEVVPGAEEPAEAAPPPAPAPLPTPDPASPAPDPAGLGSVVASAAEGAASGVAAPADPDADRPVSGVVAKAVEETSGAVTKSPVVERLPEPAAQVAKRAIELSDETQARAIEIVAATEKVVLPALPLSDEAPAGLATPAPDRPLPLPRAPVGEEPLTGAWLGHLADGPGPGGLPANPDHAAAAAATHLPHIGAASNLSELRGASPHMGPGASAGTVQRHNGSGSSPERPGSPSSSTTGLGASGSGATFFVPIVALLALLALALPAILRRLREPPDFPAPTPFVCALERPG